MIYPPTILVIFGATGDLVRRKIIPALWHLFDEKKFPPAFSVVGVSRRDLTQGEFRAHISAALPPAAENSARSDRAAFLSIFTFVQGLFEHKAVYRHIGKRLQEIERQSGVCTNKLFYLAVTPDMYRTLLTNLAHSGLSAPCADESGRVQSQLEVTEAGRTSRLLSAKESRREAQPTKSEGWSRIIVEKPFGKDADTAQALDELLGELFHEEQIYRLDHYLAKEMIQNILAFRFSNNLFESSWDRGMIERIDIRLWERIGVEERGAFYDGVGALCDIGQNHLLQVLALVTMDRPEGLSAPSLRAKRAEILRTLRAPSKKEIADTSVRAQYEGYRAIRGVAPDSQTETYFRINAAFDAPRWRGVPVMLEGGKRLGEQRKEIVITLRHPLPCLCPAGAPQHFKNRIVISLEPEEKITIHFWSKKPGFTYDLEERTFTFLLRETGRRAQYVEEYKKLLLDCITGDQTLFVSTEEVKAMWRFIDPITDAWRENAPPLLSYTPDTNEIVERAPLETRAEGTASRRASGLRLGERAGEKTEIGLPTASPPKREIGVIGLGKMGNGIAAHLLAQGWRVVVFNRSPAPIEEMARHGAVPAVDLGDFAARLSSPRLVWLMLTAGAAVDDILFGKQGLAHLLAKGDVVIDGGNSFYKDSIRRAQKLSRRGIRLLDVGVSGGPEGARKGACVMIGGKKEVYERNEALFRDLAVPGGYAYLGKTGAGHFAKMVHNGIEYGMMQSLAEGFALMKKSPFRLDLEKVAEVYNHGSVIESRLAGWLRSAYEQYGEDLKGVSGVVGRTGEGEWTVKTARQWKIPTPIIKGAVNFRVKSKESPSYIGKILSALRNQFGGHSIRNEQ